MPLPKPLSKLDLMYQDDGKYIESVRVQMEEARALGKDLDAQCDSLWESLDEYISLNPPPKLEALIEGLMSVDVCPSFDWSFTKTTENGLPEKVWVMACKGPCVKADLELEVPLGPVDDELRDRFLIHKSVIQKRDRVEALANEMHSLYVRLSGP